LILTATPSIFEPKIN